MNEIIRFVRLLDHNPLHLIERDLIAEVVYSRPLLRVGQLAEAIGDADPLTGGRPAA